MRDRDAAKRKAMASNDPRDWAKYKYVAKYNLIILMLLVSLKAILEKHGNH